MKRTTKKNRKISNESIHLPVEKMLLKFVRGKEKISFRGPFDDPYIRYYEWVATSSKISLQSAKKFIQLTANTELLLQVAKHIHSGCELVLKSRDDDGAKWIRFVVDLHLKEATGRDSDAIQGRLKNSVPPYTFEPRYGASSSSFQSFWKAKSEALDKAKGRECKILDSAGNLIVKLNPSCLTRDEQKRITQGVCETLRANAAKRKVATSKVGWISFISGGAVDSNRRKH